MRTPLLYVLLLAIAATVGYAANGAAAGRTPKPVIVKGKGEPRRRHGEIDCASSGPERASGELRQEGTAWKNVSNVMLRVIKTAPIFRSMPKAGSARAAIVLPPSP